MLPRNNSLRRTRRARHAVCDGETLQAGRAPAAAPVSFTVRRPVNEGTQR